MKKQFIAYLLIAAAVGVAAFLFQYNQPGDKVWYNIWGAAFALPIAISQIGALWYFLTSLSVFQRGLKIAYYFLAAGLVAFGLAQMQLPLTLFISTVMPEFDFTLLQLLLLIPYCFGTFVMYIAMRKFAKLLQVKSVWNSIWFILGFAVVSGVIVALFPERDIGAEDAMQINILFGLVGGSAAFAAAAAIVAGRIKAVIGDAYKPALKWLVIALATLSFAYYQLTFLQTLGSFNDFIYFTYLDRNLILIPFLLASILFLYAGQRFKLVSQQYGQTLPEKANELDVVIYTAQLVSNPRAIESTLASVRELTATRSSQQSELSTKEKTSLKEIYLKLETYLTTEEPLRKITREGLRERLPMTFQQSLGA